MKKRLLSAIAFLVMVYPFSISAMEYQHTLKLEKMEFSWSVEGDSIHIALLAKTTGWVGIGFDPEKTMQGANIIIGAVKEGKARVEDHFADRKRGHSSDEKLGGKNDVENPAGSENDGVTKISFTIPLDTGDKYDKPISPEGTTRVMLAYGSGKDSFRTRHPFRAIVDVDLSTGQNKRIK